MSKQVVFLRGKKVILRPFNKATDLETFWRWINDPAIQRFMTGYTPVELVAEERWFDQHPDRKNAIALAIETQEGQLIGNMGLHQIDWVSRFATTGAMIGEAEFRGKGYGTDAKMTLLNYAFNHLALRKILSKVLAFNGRSLRYSQRCGYREEARLKDMYFRDGEYHDEVILSVTRDIWLPLWESYQAEE